MSIRDESRFNDEDIINLARTEVEVASQEASARRKSAWFQPARLLSIAAATLLMVGVAVAVVNRDDTPSVELASAMLTDEGLPIPTSETADASFVCDEDGTNCFLEIDLTALPDAGTDDLELWVINSDVTDMESLGLVTESEGRFALPANVTPEAFPIVDISLEPNDGDSTHSGKSVLRGILGT